MTESRRRAYLDAMGFELWAVKPPAPEHDRLLFQPGEGATLLICDGPEATASRIASDIARALDGDAVWAWPDPEGRPDSPTLEEAVGQRLFTRVVLFGAALERLLFRGGPPPVIASAAVSRCGALDEIAVRGSAKQALWERLNPADATDGPLGR